MTTINDIDEIDWDSLAQEEQIASEDNAEKTDRMMSELRDIADGIKTRPEGIDGVQMAYALNDDTRRAWEVVSMPFDGYAMHNHINPNLYTPTNEIVANIKTVIDECQSIEQDGEDEQNTFCSHTDRAKRLLGWLDPLGDFCFEVPRVKAIAMLIKAESGLMTEDDRNLTGAWREDSLGLVALALTK